MYAWTTFTTELNEWGQVVKSVKPGDEVTQKDLNVSDEVWAGLIENGQVREQPYPDVPTGVAPTEYFRHLQAKAGKGKLTTREVAVLQQRSASGVEPSPSRTAATPPASEIPFKLNL